VKFLRHTWQRHVILLFERWRLAFVLPLTVRSWTLLALAGTSLFSATISAAEPPLTLADAQRRAIERSRQLAAQDASITASREMAVAAGQFPDPTVKLGVQNLPVDGPDRYSIGRDFMTMRSVGVMQELTRSEKRELRSERFEREAEKTRAEKIAASAAIERDTALAWLDRYYAEAMAKVIAEEANAAQLEIGAAEGTYRAGRGSQADVLSAHSARVGIEDRASELDRRVRNAKTNLARWIGDEADAPLAERPPIDAIRLNVATLDTDLAHHPQIAVMTKQEEIAATEAKLARANKRADLSVELMYSQRGSSFSNMVSLGVSIPLQWDQKNRQDRELGAKLAMVEEMKAEREEMLRGHIAETRAMVTEWENGRERLARYARELIPLARERTQASLAAYSGNKVSLGDLLLARRNEIDVRLQALQLDMDTARLWAQLNFLVPQDHATQTEFPSPQNHSKVSP
jgi:outer membrane protein TolC